MLIRNKINRQNVGVLIFYGHAVKLGENSEYNFNSLRALGFHFRMLIFYS